MTIIQRIGFEYYALTAVYLIFTLVPFLLEYLLLGHLPQWVEYVCFALIHNFSLIWIFHVIGFVLYRHAEELGMNESDYEPEPLFPEDPIKDRIESLLESRQPQEALNMIISLQKEEGRDDLEFLKSQALEQLNQSKQLGENEQITNLIEQGKLMQALKLANQMLEQQRAYRPESPQYLAQLIEYARQKQQLNTIVKLVRGMANDYPESHQLIVDHYFIMAKILYENKKKGKAITLLNRTISRYEKTANIKQLRAYLKGVHLKKP